MPRSLAIVIQARVGSQRLPAKALRTIEGKPMIGWVIERTAQSKRCPRVICALPDSYADDDLARVCTTFGAEVHRGSEHDVLGRYVDCCDRFELTDVVRITGDCPLIDPVLIDGLVDVHTQDGSDLTWNPVEQPGAFPRGMDVEVIRATALRFAVARASTSAHREHVTLYCYERPDELRIRTVWPTRSEARPEFRLCVDHENDLALVQSLIQALDGRNDFTLAQLIAVLDEHPEIAAINERFKNALHRAGC
jgi:spore coat polysaccharide biosynthesis protein SpsF